MDCIICGNWFSSLIHDGACPTCSRAIKQLVLNMTPNRILELAQAEKDGRLVVLPCKMGDVVYEPNKRGFVSTYKIISIHISVGSMLVGWDLIDGIYSNINGFEASSIGKTVFLTREEAEAALKSREANNEAK